MHLQQIQQLDLHNTEAKYSLMMAVIHEVYYALDTVVSLIAGLI